MRIRVNAKVGIWPVSAPAEESSGTRDHITCQRRGESPAEASPHKAQVSFCELVFFLHPVSANQGIFANRNRKRILARHVEDALGRVGRGVAAQPSNATSSRSILRRRSRNQTGGRRRSTAFTAIAISFAPIHQCESSKRRRSGVARPVFSRGPQTQKDHSTHHVEWFLP